jgi:thiol-disulfide isomerase/thioredoxin
MAAVFAAGLWLGPALGAELSEAEKAWEEFQLASRTPPTPKEWRAQRPTKEEYEKYLGTVKETLLRAVDKAKDFYTRFPDDPNAPRARRKEYEFLNRLISMGQKGLEARVVELEKARLADGSLSEEDRFEIRQKQVERRVHALQEQGTAAMLAELEKGARELQKEFPGQPEVYEMLFSVVANAEGEKGRELARELLKEPRAPQAVKERCAGLLKRLEALGKPLELSFTALDGREVKLSDYKGKVVLVDFWATWCGPCVAELPNVLKTYEELHPKGFEIVGISFDNSKEALQKFVKEKNMPWPQYFDGKAWGNKFGQEFGITAIPTMWLVDKKGVLVDMNARANLADKVRKLLAE